MYYPDLSTYEYGLDRPLPGVLNVGWLDRAEPYATGAVPDLFAERLRIWFGSARINQMRGIHQCNLCHNSRSILLPISENPSCESEGKSLFFGNWEIWIPSSNQIVFACPALIIHYVESHKYRPPNEFISAVMGDDLKGNWNAGREFEKRVKAGSP